MQPAYRIVTRKGAAHQHPVLVFDLENRLHVPLTIFSEEAMKRSSLGTARTYLHAAARSLAGWKQTTGKGRRTVGGMMRLKTFGKQFKTTWSNASSAN
jgi:hypothetical protein